MKEERDGRFELQPILRSALPDVAGFLHRWYNSGAEPSASKRFAGETLGSIERRLTWLLIENPTATNEPTLGFCLRDGLGVIRGINLSFPVAYVSSEKRLLGLCFGSFFVESPARSLGFYLFKRCLNTPGYSFYFAATCNTQSSQVWRGIGASAVPNSETEYILPIKLDMVMAAYVAYRTSSQVAARIARTCGRSANPILRFMTRPSAKLAIEPCRDWEKLSELSRCHRSPDHITSDRSPAFLQWRYGSCSPSHPCSIYLFRDTLGNEGWFSLAHVTRGAGWQFRASVLLDVIWPRERISYSYILGEILRVTAATADVISFRWQPGLDNNEFSRYVIRRKLVAPRAFVRIPKGAPTFPIDSLDYDDSDYIAWAFPERDA